MSELNSILDQYVILIEAMKQLEQDVPVIEAEYQNFKASIKEQVAITEKSIASIESQSEASIKRLLECERTTDAMLRKQADNMKLIETSMSALQALLRLADNKINTLTKLINEQATGTSEMERRIVALERKCSSGGNVANYPETFEIRKKWLPSTKIFPSAKSKFDSDAMNFTFDRQKTVKYKKPYGIVIEGEILEADAWTTLLERVVYHSFDSYGANQEELCSDKYGITISTEVEFTIPYFIEGNVTKRGGYQYRYLNAINLSVLYGGADKVVDVIKALLCDYLRIIPRNVELFYYKKY